MKWRKLRRKQKESSIFDLPTAGQRWRKVQWPCSPLILFAPFGILIPEMRKVSCFGVQEGLFVCGGGGGYDGVCECMLILHLPLLSQPASGREWKSQTAQNVQGRIISKKEFLKYWLDIW